MRQGGGEVREVKWTGLESYLLSSTRNGARQCDDAREISLTQDATQSGPYVVTGGKERQDIHPHKTDLTKRKRIRDLFSSTAYIFRRGYKRKLVDWPLGLSRLGV